MADQDQPLDQAADAETTSSTTAAAVAVALGRASGSSDLNDKAAEFLKKQSRMLDLQMEGLAEDRALQHRHLALRYFGDRLRIGLQLIGIALGVIVLFGVGALVWSAHEDKGLVIEAFSVPPDLAQRGLTGQVVASQLLDKLSQMQADTESARPASTYANDWGGEIKVEIPQTGVSIGEAYRYLRGWLGHETQITGEVVRTATGLAITARAGASPGKTAQGADADLDKLLQQAAEGVYGQTQPYRYAAFLASQGRRDEALATFQALSQTGSREDRLWALTGAANVLDLRRTQEAETQAEAYADAALRLEPRFLPALVASISPAANLGQTERGAQVDREILRLLQNGQGLGMTTQQKEDLLHFAKGSVAFDSGDFLTTARIDHGLTVGPQREGAQAIGAGFFEALSLALDHDGGGSRAAEASIASRLPPDLARTEPVLTAVRAWRAGDWAAMDPAAEADLAGAEGAPSAKRLVALAQAELGRLDEADATIGPTPLDCPDCVNARAQIAALRGDWRGADRWSALAVKVAPDLPFPDWHWGDLYLARGDPDRAIAEYQLAHRKGPHFADPLEGWGEALMRKGDYADAVAKFAEADKDAPRWGRNHMMWGVALAKLGHTAEARAQYQAATGMDLSVADRATLVALMKGA
jgi:tetratricopeptide (TPR) repeat protein